MVYVVVGLYCIGFSFVCYYYTKQQCEREIFELKEEYEDQVLKLKNKVNKLWEQQQITNQHLIKSQYTDLEKELNKRVVNMQNKISKQTDSYLSKINNRVSSTMDKIKEDIKNKPVI